MSKPKKKKKTKPKRTKPVSLSFSADMAVQILKRNTIKPELEKVMDGKAISKKYLKSQAIKLINKKLKDEGLR